MAAEETMDVWSDAFELFGDYPLVVARIGDLLWLRRYGDKPYKYAHAALAAMRSLWGYSGMEEVCQADNLVRALDLACELNDQPLIASISQDMVAAAKSSLRASDWAPGVQMRLIERVSALPRRQRPAGLEEVLDLVSDAFESDPFLFAAVLKCQLQLDGDDQEARRATARRMVRSWESAAEKAEPLVAQKHLEQALEIELGVPVQLVELGAVLGGSLFASSIPFAPSKRSPHARTLRSRRRCRRG
ncbi:MAG: hypothetical protein AUG49_16340 [Catenulispora sp. 13_1_20CM_3_70_7]|nr:MAG: hypothetical protein AUG49_16340 [Catenulispora sp. 13_1_20CM_3_70_7]